jgi:hypothetical protein
MVLAGNGLPAMSVYAGMNDSIVSSRDSMLVADSLRKVAALDSMK